MPSRRRFRRRVLPVLLPMLLAALAATAAMPARAQPTLNVYNWTDYIDPEALRRFTQETGVRVRYDVYDSLETLEAKLSAGRSGYDIVVPTSEPTFARLVRAGALRPLDAARIPNLANLDPALMRRVAAIDPGNRHGAIYLWGTTGLGMRADRVRALAPDAPTDSLDLLMKPENARRLAGCGIMVMDSPTDVLPSVQRWLGRDPNGTSAEDLRAAGDALMAIRRHVRAIIPSSSILDALASGEACVALTYSGDVIQAQARAREANRGVEVAYVMPRGAQLWFDMLAIPADAPNAMCTVPRIFSSSSSSPVRVAFSFVPIPSSATRVPSAPAAVSCFISPSPISPVASTKAPFSTVSSTGSSGPAR